MAQILDLPIEIVAGILDDFRKTSSTSEYAKCLLVSKTWCEIGTVLLYQDVHLHNSNLKTFNHGVPLYRLHNIRSITVTIWPPKVTDAEYVDFGRRGVGLTQQLWGRLRKLASILSRLDNLLSFSLKLVDWTANASNETEINMYDFSSRPTETVAQILDALPISCTSLQLDTGHEDKVLMNSDRLSGSISRILNQLVRLRLCMSGLNGSFLLHQQLPNGRPDFSSDSENGTESTPLEQRPLTQLKELVLDATISSSTTSTLKTNVLHSLRERLPSLTKCTVIEHYSYGSRSGPHRIHWTWINVRDMLRSKTIAYPYWPLDPKDTSSSLDKFCLRRLQGNQIVDVVGTYEALLLFAQDNEWPETINGCCLPRKLANGWMWRHPLQYRTKDNTSPFNSDCSLWRKEDANGASIIGPKGIDDIWSNPPNGYDLGR